MTRAVVDPSVLVSGFIGRVDAGPGRLVQAWRARRFTMVVSPLLLDELADVLRRPKLARWVGEDRGAASVAGFATRGEHHRDPRVVESSGLRDANDEYLVALARATKADMLVSIDRDLLEAELDDVRVVRPAESLRRLDETHRQAPDFAGRWTMIGRVPKHVPNRAILR